MILTHRKFYFNLNEERRLLRESQESKSQSAAKKLVMQKLGYNEQQADEFVRMKLRNDLPALRKSGPAKFTLAATRMFLDGQLNNANTISSLNTVLEYAANEKHYNEFDRDLNGISAQELIKMMQPEIDADLQKSQDEINSTQYTRNANYDIMRIDSFEQSQQYGQYTSWCITYREDMWDTYTSNGINQFYFCLKKGFENMPAQEGEGCPLDEYGLSMIAVSVNPMGRLNTCTCRWNHNNGGNDNIMDAKQISQVIGRNFYSTFKPNEKGTKYKKLYMIVQKGMNLSDEEVKNLVFNFNNDDTIIVTTRYQDKYNFITDDGKLLFNQWTSFIGKSDKHKIYSVELNGKYNFFRANGMFLFKSWIKEFIDFDGRNDRGIAVLENGEKYLICINEDTFTTILIHDNNDGTYTTSNGFTIDSTGKIINSGELVQDDDESDEDNIATI